MEVPEHLIDIEALFASKNPALKKLIPGFVLRYLKKITHQDEINGYIWRNRDKSGLPFVDAILKEFGVHVVMVDRRKKPAYNTGDDQHDPVIPPTGRFIVAANHPLGGLDGMALMFQLGKFRQDLVFPVNDLLMNVPGLRPLFIPINKHGRNTENAKLIDETFASGKMVLYFPAGLVSRKHKLKRLIRENPGKWTISPGNGMPIPVPGSCRNGISGDPTFFIPASTLVNDHSVIRDLEWKSTFIKKAKKYQRSIIPVFIEGRNSEWFYNLANWRKSMGIGANIEMLYLVDEMVKQLGKTITIMVGDPISWTTFDRTKTDSQWASLIKEKVYELG